MQWRFFSCGFLLCLCSAPIANAEPGDRVNPSVVIVSLETCCATEAWPEAEEKVVREFLQAGLDVVTVQGSALSESDRRKELSRLADEYNSAAAVRIVRPKIDGQAGVDLWITDRVTGKIVYRYLPLDDTQSEESSLVAGLKTLELFRGSLQEIHLAGARTAAAPKEIERLTSKPITPDFLHFRLGGGFSGIFFNAEVMPRGAPSVVFGWMPVHRFLLLLQGSFGVIGSDITDGTNTSSLSVSTVVVKPMWEFRTRGLLRPAAGVFAGGAFVVMEGNSPFSQAERTDRMSGMVVGGTGRLGFALTDAFWITSAVDGGLMVPQGAVYFDGRKVAVFGAPMFQASLLLEVHF